MDSDLIHHVTYVNTGRLVFFHFCQFLSFEASGGGDLHQKLWRDFSWRGRAYETVRDVARWLGLNAVIVRMTVNHSILAVNYKNAASDS